MNFFKHFQDNDDKKKLVFSAGSDFDSPCKKKKKTILGIKCSDSGVIWKFFLADRERLIGSYLVSADWGKNKYLFNKNSQRQNGEMIYFFRKF